MGIFWSLKEYLKFYFLPFYKSNLNAKKKINECNFEHDLNKYFGLVIFSFYFCE